MFAALPPLSAASLHAAHAAGDSARVRFRRALVLMLMTVVLPGSAQLVAGDKRVGRIAMRTFAAAVAFVLVLGMLAVWWPTTLVSVATEAWFLGALRFGLVAYAVLWAYLVIDAWRIAEPLGLVQRHRLTLTAVNGLLCFTLSGSLLYASHLVAVQDDFISAVFAGDDATEPAHGRYNILLLGGDAGPGRNGLRPDSITVASIDEETGRTVLIGLPRNLAKVPFPEDSPMHREFPHGFTCEGCYLNGVNTWANDNAELYPDAKEPGITATTEAVEEISGLTINYYVIIDLHGFRDLVDAVGGIDIKVGRRLPIGGVGGPITGWIERGQQHLDGFETLWYTRSRATSDDYSRMARQKCVMNAMLRQLDPTTVVTNFADIAKAGKQVIATSIPRSEISTFVSLSLKAKSLPVSSVSFVPPRINTGDPDWDLMRQMVEDAIQRSAAMDTEPAAEQAPVTDASQAPDHDRQHTKAKKRDRKPGNANASTDLAQSC
ncbi:MAG: LCP family protein [Nocardioidaceae bacterium]